MQDNSSNTLSIWERGEQIRWLMKWPAMTVMVFTRWDLGYRILSPVGIIAMFLVVMLISGNTRPANRPQDLAIFAWLMLAAGILQRLLRWREVAKGVQSHSYYIGTSFIHLLARKRFLRSERRTARFIEPPFILALGILLNRLSSHAFGGWLIFCSIALFIYEDAVYRLELNRKLDMSDGLINANRNAEDIEEVDNSRHSNQSKDKGRGLPTGLGDDVRRPVNRPKPE